jgi:hypothetical protein
MTSKQLFSIGLMAIALICTGPGQGTAASDKASLWVSATVTPWFKAQAIQQTSSYQVTREDIARGYTDLFAAVSIQFQTNIIDGKILLQVANSGAEQVLVKQAGTISDQLFIALLAENRQEKQTYDLRVVLSPEVVVGTYPLRLSMQTTVL